MVIQKKHDKVKRKDKKTTRMTFYMSPGLYLRWSQYKVNQLEAGKKLTFQGVVEEYLNQIID